MRREAMWKILALVIITTAGIVERYLKLSFNKELHRNPSDHDNPWCYKETNGKWEDCEVPLCSSITTTTPSSISISSSSASSSSSTVASTTGQDGTDCLAQSKGLNYRGSVGQTVSGRKCGHLPFSQFFVRCNLHEVD